MMNMVAIDTLQYTKRLRDTGVDPGQAEAMAEALGEALTVNLATKDDLEVLRSDLKSDIKTLEAELNGRIDNLDAKIDSVATELNTRIDSVNSNTDTKIESLRAEMKEDSAKNLRWTITSQMAFAGLIVALIKFL